MTEANTPKKLHSCSHATPRWWASSWAMVEGSRQAGLSTFTLDSPTQAKYTPVKPMTLMIREQRTALTPVSGNFRKGNSSVTPP